MDERKDDAGTGGVEGRPEGQGEGQVEGVASGEIEEEDGPPAHLSEAGVSRLSPRWWVKTLLFAVVLIGFGVWGLVDALVVYPERGIADAERKEKEYLRAWSQTARTSAASVADPRGELIRLRERTGGAAGAGALSPMDLAKREWLVALSRVSRLKEEYTTIEDPMARLTALEDAWRTRTAPAALEAYDIPSQWLFVAIGFSIGPWLLVKLVRVSGRKYRWTPEGERLTLPGGQEIGPGDLEDVDKRRWDKFIVFLKIKKEHAGLGGQEIKIDLYHHDQRLEDWVLAMERTAFPDRDKEEDEAKDGGSGGEAGRTDSEDGEGGGGGGGDD